MATLLTGKAVSASILDELAPRILALGKAGVTPTLAVLRVGARPDDLAYEAGAEKRCRQLSIGFRSVVLPETVTQAAVLDAIRSINADRSIHGCLLLRPLPKAMDERMLTNSLSPDKDVDGMTEASLAGVFTGSGTGYAPCTAQACMELLRYYGVGVSGKNVVVVGRSLVVGRPVSMLLMAQNATVTLCHTRTVDLPGLCQKADILVAAAGRAELLTGDYFSAGQTVLDVGMQMGPKGTLTGDVAFDQAEPIVKAITPVPGGIGAVTTAVLMRHIVEAAEKAAGKTREQA